MGCNCRGGGTYSSTSNRPTKPAIEGLCQKIGKEQLGLPIKVSSTGGLLLPSMSLPAHMSLSTNRCTGAYVEKILTAELTLSAAFNNNEWKTEFLSRLGANPTLGSIEALIKVMT